MFIVLYLVASVRRVAIPKIQPERPVLPQDSPDLPENLHDVLDVKLRRGLQPKMAHPGAAPGLGSGRVIPQGPIRRARDADLDAPRLHPPQTVEDVALKDGQALALKARKGGHGFTFPFASSAMKRRSKHLEQMLLDSSPPGTLMDISDLTSFPQAGHFIMWPREYRQEFHATEHRPPDSLAWCSETWGLRPGENQQ